MEGDGLDEQVWLQIFRQAILEQDQTAWKQIWERFQSEIERRVRRELAGLVPSGEEPIDLVQEIFCKYWEDTRSWTSVDRLFSDRSGEGAVSRLHSTAVYQVQKRRQRLVRSWIPVIRRNLPRLGTEEAGGLHRLAGSELPDRYRRCLIPHLEGRDSQFIARQLELPVRQVSIQVNRAWERFTYVLLRHRGREPGFEPTFRFLIEPRSEVPS